VPQTSKNQLKEYNETVKELENMRVPKGVPKGIMDFASSGSIKEVALNISFSYLLLRIEI